MYECQYPVCDVVQQISKGYNLGKALPANKNFSFKIIPLIF